MANNRKPTRGRKDVKQTIYSEPQRILKERYITDHMLEKAIRNGLTKKEALAKYGKNRYVTNPNAKPIKVIFHTNI
jgi:hypothetical protein